ncbi:flagellar brake protein [Chitinibacter sp. GC72]|uniref:flagellar brake protein n=1 Tax=Chitinibacter sp. GC72 TaxID=1526917 RepID=UPI0012F97278|nr:flagellar brake protein [Chitinibacter sp. GC72]
MNEEENQGPNPIHTEQDIAPFLLKTPLEIAYVLRLLEQAHSNIAIYFNTGHDMMLTRILSADAKAKQFVFDISGHEPTNAALLLADKLLFVGDLDGVKIQFSTVKPGRVLFEGKTAFMVSLPNDMVKLQRREFFRLTTPISSPYTIALPLASGSLTLELHDISLGGVGLWLKDEQQKKLFNLGDVVHKASIDLGTAGRIQADIELRNLHTVYLKQGMTRWMLGVQFMNLSRANESLLQKLMVQLEREQKALTG